MLTSRIFLVLMILPGVFAVSLSLSEPAYANARACRAALDRTLANDLAKPQDPLSDLLTVPRFKINESRATQFLSQRLIQEFSLKGKERKTAVAFSELLLNPEKMSARSGRIIAAFLKSPHLENAWVRRQGEAILDRKLNLSEQTALRIVHVFDRDLDLVPFSIKAPDALYVNAKIRLLSIAGFLQGERAKLLASTTALRDDPLDEVRFSFNNQASDVSLIQLQARNQTIINEGMSWKHSTAVHGNRKLALSEIDAQALLVKLQQNPITRFENRLKYDPDGSRGFCFGRAFAGHLLALKTGVEAESIRKVFVSGDMKTTDGTIWSFHVAVMVAREDGGFWVLDPNYLKVQTLADWYKHFEMQSMDHRLRLYVTPAARFGAEGFADYDRGTLSNPFYNHYFDDFLADYRKN